MACLKNEIKSRAERQRKELEAIFSRGDENDSIEASERKASLEGAIIALEGNVARVQEERRIQLWLRLWRFRYEERRCKRELMSACIARATLWRLCAIQMWALDTWWRLVVMRRTFRSGLLRMSLSAFRKNKDRRRRIQALADRARIFRRRGLAKRFFYAAAALRSKEVPIRCRAQAALTLRRRSVTRRALAAWRLNIRRKIRVRQHAISSSRRKVVRNLARLAISNRHSRQRLTEARLFWHEARLAFVFSQWRQWLQRSKGITQKRLTIKQALRQYQKKHVIKILLTTVHKSRHTRELSADAESRAMARAFFKLHNSIAFRSLYAKGEAHWNAKCLARAFSTLRRRLLVSARLARALDAIALRSSKARGLRALWLCRSHIKSESFLIEPAVQIKTLRLRRALEALGQIAVSARVQYHLTSWATRRALRRSLRRFSVFAAKAHLNKCRLEAAVLHHNRNCLTLSFRALLSHRPSRIAWTPPSILSSAIATDELIATYSQQEDTGSPSGLILQEAQHDEDVNSEICITLNHDTPQQIQNDAEPETLEEEPPSCHQEGLAIFELLKLAAPDDE